MRIDPDMRNTIWPYRGIAHLLSDTWPAVSICTRIDPAFNSFRNKNAISTRPQLHPQCRRMAVERQPFLVAAQHNLHRPACLARKASDNRFNPHKGFCAESPSHRWTDNAHLVVRDVKDAGQIRTQVERGLRTCPDLKPAPLPASHRGVWLHRGVLGARCSISLFDDHIRLFEAFLIAVPDAKAVTNIRTLLRPHIEVGSIVIRNRMVLVDERRLF